jgi:hypothetical protein
MKDYDLLQKKFLNLKKVYAPTDDNELKKKRGEKFLELWNEINDAILKAKNKKKEKVLRELRNDIFKSWAS